MCLGDRKRGREVVCCEIYGVGVLVGENGQVGTDEGGRLACESVGRAHVSWSVIKC